MWPFSSSSSKFKGIDLNKFHYLGRTVASYVKNGESTQEIYLYYFCHKDDDKKRKLVKETQFKSKRRAMNFHPYVKSSELWAIGQGPIYDLVLEPSEYLCNYMLNLGPYVYDAPNKRWLLSNVPASKPVATKKGDNVLHVKFTKD